MDTKLKVRRLAHAHGWFIGFLSWWVGDVNHVLSICHVAGKGPIPRESPRVYPCEAELIAPIQRRFVKSSIEGTNGASHKLGIDWAFHHFSIFFLRNQADAYSQQEITEIFRTFYILHYFNLTRSTSVAGHEWNTKYNLINAIIGGAIRKSDPQLHGRHSATCFGTTEWLRLKH